MCIRDSASDYLQAGKSKELAKLVQFERRPYSAEKIIKAGAVSYTHLRAHETVLDLVCRLLLEKKKKTTIMNLLTSILFKHK